MPEDRRKVYSEIIFALLREACRTGLLETQMLTQLMEKYRNEFRGFYEEGVADGEKRGRADSVLLLLRARGVAVPEPTRQRILSCQDQEVLGRWLVRAASATAVEEFFLD